ncbi:MAG: hypothetical protein SO133_06045, partial [Alloprevotella sp.]|nr:hypothetical protein [Alloprevotella sp.]
LDLSFSKHTKTHDPHVATNVRYIAFSMSFNENKLRTHTLQSKVRYFHVTPPTAEPHAHKQGAVHFFPAQFAIINPPE